MARPFGSSIAPFHCHLSLFLSCPGPSCRPFFLSWCSSTTYSVQLPERSFPPSLSPSLFPWLRRYSTGHPSPLPQVWLAPSLVSSACFFPPSSLLSQSPSLSVISFASFVLLLSLFFFFCPSLHPLVSPFSSPVVHPR